MRYSLLALLLSITLLGCKQSRDPSAKPNFNGRLVKVLATTGMIADAAQAIGGENVEVNCLMGPGIDPHRYLPTARDLTHIRQADLVLYNGLHLEGKMTDVLANRGHWTVGVAEGLEGLRNAEEGFEGAHDPHVWFDVKLWMKVVEKIRDSLVDIDPTHATDYRERAEKYLVQLAKLDEEVRHKIHSLPETQRVLITAHDAFGYFGRAYGIEVRGLQGVSTATDTSGKNVQELAELIGSRKIKAIFAETSVSDKGMLAVRQAVREKYSGFDVRLAEQQLYSDALGETNGPAGTYIGMVTHNVDAIVKALQ
jgi:manganese/zinc/iron transport system substrate-binding protein